MRESSCCVKMIIQGVIMLFQVVAILGVSAFRYLLYLDPRQDPSLVKVQSKSERGGSTPRSKASIKSGNYKL